MPSQRLEQVLLSELNALNDAGAAKGRETVIAGVIAPDGNRGPRYLLAGEGDRRYLRMNANSYLGMSLREDVIAAG